MEDARVDGRSAGGELQLPRGVPDAHAHDGLVQAGGRGPARDPQRVRLESGRPAVLQPRRALAHGPFQVPLHDVRRLHRAWPGARVPELQRHRQPRRVQGAAHRALGARKK